MLYIAYCTPTGSGKTYKDLLYYMMEERGVYSYWESYCKKNNYYMFVILGDIYE